MCIPVSPSLSVDLWLLTSGSASIQDTSIIILTSWVKQVDGGLGTIICAAGVEPRLQVQLVVVTLIEHKLLNQGFREIQGPVQ